MERRVESFIRKYKMIEKGDTVIAGVSGGADSVCLLFVLRSLSRKIGFDIKVCHVNHCLRGEAADRDQDYVAGLCRRLDVPCRVFCKDVESIAKKRKQSCEEAGRTVRREAFETMCLEDGGTKIALAHHRDDNAETVLLNVARGTGLKGLCGILPVSGKWIRPLLVIGRDEAEKYLEDLGEDWCTDATNEEDIYTRNRIRHNVLPFLEEQINSGVVRHLDELSRQAREIWDYLEKGTDDAWERCVSVKETPENKERQLEVSGELFRAEMPAVQNQLLHRCIAFVRGGYKDIETAHVAAVRDLFERQTGRRLDLPGGLSARRIYSGILISKKADEGSGPINEGKDRELQLVVPGETPVPGTGMKFTCSFVSGVGPEEARQVPQKSYTKWIDYDIIKYGLTIRTRRPGDFFTVNEQGGKQKLKAYFVNEKISREERDKMLLVADGSHIVWIPGRRMSRAYQIGDKTKKILEINLTEEKENGRDNQSIGSGR